MKVYQCPLFVSLVAMVFLSCAGQNKARVANPSNTKSMTVKDFEKMREDFDIAALDDYDITIEESDINYADVNNTEARTGEVSADTVGTGYRVQLMQTTEPDEAKEIEREAILRFQEDVYRVFDPPYYKVRLGDFATWYDAEKVQKLAIQRGFREAWVVRTKVNLKKAYKWLDEL
ncbi:MAG: SPOR domain-containing protein [bacterium]